MVGVSALSLKSLAGVLGLDLRKDKWLVHSIVLVGQLFGEFLDAVEWELVDGHPYSYDVGDALGNVDSLFISGRVEFNPEFISFVRKLSGEDLMVLGRFIFDCVYSNNVVDCEESFPKNLEKYKSIILEKLGLLVKRLSNPDFI